MEVYDYTTAAFVEEKDCIMIGFDPVEVISYVDEGDTIAIHGISHQSGDIVDYMLSADTEVGLWGA